MSSSPSQVSQLGRKPHSYSMLLRSFADQNDQTPKLEEFISRLEEERIKIDAFKRELPLCMQLLTSAVENSRKQLQACRGNEGPIPVLEEFIPLKTSTSETPEMTANISDKASWMTTAQLWSQDSIGTKPQTTLSSPKQTDIGFNVSSKLVLDTKQRNGGAFLPFSKERNMCPGPTLALAACTDEQLGLDHKKFPETENGFSCPNRESCGNKMAVIEQGKGGGNSSSSDGQETNAATIASANTSTSQTHRKARRCWSPDLHRRFVNALHLLGGSQVATPKQIRELMKVDGLTNDEVKSHLQKYRLHTRRPSPSPQAAGAPAPHLVVLGGIWVPPEYATAASAAHSGGATLYGAHPASHAPPPLFCAPPPASQDFFTAVAAPPPPLHDQTLRHQIQLFKPTSQVPSSPESDFKGSRDRSESIEDGKSESSSWKGESGENDGGERKGRAALREEGEESNGSKF
ncbi:MYB-LIKE TRANSCRIPTION FACTOR FAMILY PROTEIN [Salix koriyanagi]|uniref:MYB-LIKE TRANSCRIPTION FACTOR FAMILY PROTEIN n=1 Tax=Salix koriyanagi TaxID=2511006 RepID=A0A9Q0VDH3_9ROSI|nr:MYB-LIKE TRANSCRIPTION FACTOR FAMILY PROTEIN [Salix koriyanagi]